MIETLRIINQMKADGVIAKYAIGGAIGAAFYLEPTSSLDIDIFISFPAEDRSLAPLEPIYRYLRDKGAEVRGEHLLLEGWLVQFLPAEDPLNREALELAVETEVRGVRMRVMSAEYLIAIALRLGRAKDFARIERFLELEKYDPGKLEDVLRRHSLIDKWRRLNDRHAGEQSD